MSLPYRSKLIPRAKALRGEATKEETRLWYQFLRGYPLRFQRQKSIGGYIVDFYCHAARLVVELDGSQHYQDNGPAYDRARTAFLSQHGLYILRFPNFQVNREFKVVCQEIDRVARSRLK